MRGVGFTKEKLDRAMANQRGMDQFSRTICLMLLTIRFDHSPLIITVTRTSESMRMKQYIFKYEAAWDLKNDCVEVIKKAWQDGNTSLRHMTDIHYRIRNCKSALLKWKRTVYTKENARKRDRILKLCQIQSEGKT